MGKWNLKLIIGTVLVCFFILIAVIGPFISPYDVNEATEIKYISTEHGGKILAPPFPPSKEHIFGTDKWGYDIFTQILYGAKYTVFTVLIVAFLRVAIGSLIGIFVALNNKSATQPKIEIKINVFSGFPVFIFIYFVLIRINLEPVMKPETLTLITGSLMVLLGLMGVYSVVYGKTIELKKNLYVIASQMMGGSKWHIAKKHIFPALINQLLIIFINEAIQVLHLLGQLGIFHLFLGGTHVRMDPPIYISITKEWAGLIGQSRNFLYHSQWIILFPLLYYLLFLFSFYMIEQGIKQQEKVKQRKPTFL
jgi:peptide/nickel transport system permease protein